MSNASIAEFEARATQADKMIETLTARMDQIEGVIGKGGGNESLEKYKYNLLDELREVRIALGKDQRSAMTVVKERDELQERVKKLEEENKTLRTITEKQQYRIKHLLRSVN